MISKKHRNDHAACHYLIFSLYDLKYLLNGKQGEIKSD